MKRNIHAAWLAAAAISAPAVAQAPASTPSAEHPPIAIRFSMPSDGYATLVIEDAGGKRVRNLVSETPFAKGPNTVYWDGLDDLGRDPEAATHGVYRIPGRLVSPGKYLVRGLFRPEINLHYEMTPYTHGDPPWEAPQRSAQCLANHTPPSAVLFVPPGLAPTREGMPTSAGGQVLVGSWVTEGGSGLAWLDEDGRKLNMHAHANTSFNTTLVLLRVRPATPLRAGLYQFQHHAGAIEGWLLRSLA